MASDRERETHEETLEAPVAARPAESLGEEVAAGTHIEVGTQVGRLVVLGRLGEGGTALVYLAYDRELDRKVALKLMRPNLVVSARATLARQRLLREAQALARLSHPNVVAIYDVGTYGGLVFISEAFVDGANVREWAKAKPRTVREILHVFLEAGRGLAAAHAAGIVHRDFKPDNVLVGKDGRVQITDFGLARAVGTAEPGEKEVAQARAKLPSVGILESSLTRTGTIMGTPAYMAPEQHRGEPSDARADQFSFCAALYEMLYGELPFAGKTAGELACEATQGRVRPAPKGTKVPGWIRRVLLKGLSPLPDDRYPSMDALLSALSRDTVERLRRVGAVVGLLLLVGGVAFGIGMYGHRGARLCKGGEERLQGVWGEAERQAVRQAFLATGKPYAEASWRGMVSAIDAHVAAWLKMRRDACEATWVRGEQSQALLDARMGCLDRRLQELRALVEVLRTADASVVERAARMGGTLGDLAICADPQALQTPTPEPKDPEGKQALEKVRALVAQAKALETAGKYADAVRVAAQAVAEARKREHRSLEAEALTQLGSARMDAGEVQQAEQDLKEAVVAAVEGQHREAAATAAILLTHHVGYTQRRAEEGHFWGRYAKAVLTTLGKNDPLEARWHNAVAGVYFSESKYDKQLFHNQRALALRQKAFGPVHVAVGSSLNNLGVTYSALGDPRQSAQYFAKAKEVFEKISGPEHPDVALALMNLASIHGDLGEYAKQRAFAEKAVALFGRLVGEEHPRTASALMSLASALHHQDDHKGALATYQRILTIFEKKLGPRHPDTAGALDGIARELRCLGGRAKEAVAHARRAVDIVEAALGKEHPELAGPLSSLGLAELGARNIPQAVATLERALNLRKKAAALPQDMAETEFGLAQALWEQGKDRTRALELAESAQARLRRVPAQRNELLKISVWLSARKKPPKAEAHSHEGHQGHPLR